MLNALRTCFPRGFHYCILEKNRNEIDRWLMKILHYPGATIHRRQSRGPADFVLEARGLGWVPHALPVIFFFETVAEAIAAASVIGRKRVTGNEAAFEQAHALLSRMELAHLADRNPFSLSGGESRLVWFLCQLAKQPEYLMIENILSGFAQETALRLLAFIDEMTGRAEPAPGQEPVFIIGHTASGTGWMEQLISNARWKQIPGWPLRDAAECAA